MNTGYQGVKEGTVSQKAATHSEKANFSFSKYARTLSRARLRWEILFFSSFGISAYLQRNNEWTSEDRSHFETTQGCLKCSYS